MYRVMFYKSAQPRQRSKKDEDTSAKLMGQLDRLYYVWIAAFRPDICSIPTSVIYERCVLWKWCFIFEAATIIALT